MKTKKNKPAVAKKPGAFKPSATFKTDAKTLSRLRRKLREKNARFAKLTRAEQRVKIAEDVLEQLATKKMVAKSTYFSLPTAVENKVCDLVDAGKTSGIDASELTSQVQCEVCGIGSLFVAGVEFHDKLKLNKFHESGMVNGDTRELQVNYLKKWFPEEMLDRVERYFELNNPYYEPENNSPIKRQKSRHKRLVMIMENIISNNGRFDPGKGAHQHDEEVASDDFMYEADMYEAPQ